MTFADLLSHGRKNARMMRREASNGRGDVGGGGIREGGSSRRNLTIGYNYNQTGQFDATQANFSTNVGGVGGYGGYDGQFCQCDDAG